MKLFVKKQLNNVAGDLLNLDEKRTYKIRPDEMASILN